MNGEAEKQNKTNVERLRDIRGRKPARTPKPSKWADPEKRRAELKAKRDAKRQATLEKRRVREEAESRLKEQLKTIEAARAAYAEYRETDRNPVELSHEQQLEVYALLNKQRDEGDDASYSTCAASLLAAKEEPTLESLRNALEAEVRAYDERQRVRASGREELRNSHLDELLRREVERARQEAEKRDEALRRELLAEQTLRKANFERAKQKDAIRRQMQAEGLLDDDEVARAETEFISRSRSRNKKKVKPDVEGESG